MDKSSQEYRETRRLYAIEYRKKNAQKLKDQHNWRLENDEDYARRYKEKQVRRNEQYALGHEEAARKRKIRSIELAAARKIREKERVRKSRENPSDEERKARNEYARKWNAKNRDRLNAEKRERLKNDPEYAAKINAQDRARYPKKAISQRSNRLNRTYGITLEDYKAMYSAQDGKCWICEESKPPNGKGGLVVDHCHTKGHVRGLLCSSCNTGIGKLKESIKSLQRAIEYLSN